jgi:beta-ribofuranosylaminobenzene 5'-phosphate synthase
LRIVVADGILLGMTTSVTVTTGARLHFGPLAAAGATGGRFGGAGMMISAPGCVVDARWSGEDAFLGDEPTVARVADFVRRIRETTRTGVAIPPCRIEVRRTIPSHAGLGSGTQLGLAVARSLSELAGERDVPVEMLARRAGRGLRSAIGLHGFGRGGFLVDGGRSDSGQLGSLVARVEFPAAWRLILAAPPASQGLSGADEQQAFSVQPPMPQSLTAELCRIVLMDWLPSLHNADFAHASAAMYEFGLNVGRFFEPVQGDVFADPRMSDLARELRRAGVEGVAQTSWGPTICVLAAGEASATELVRNLTAEPRWSGCSFQVVEPLNRGASVTKSLGAASRM